MCEWIGVKWNGMEWYGMEWNGADWKQVLCLAFSAEKGMKNRRELWPFFNFCMEQTGSKYSA